MSDSAPHDLARLVSPHDSRMEDGLRPLGPSPSVQQAADPVFHLADVEVVRDGNNARVPHVKSIVDGNFDVGQIETCEPFAHLDEAAARFLSGDPQSAES